MLTSNNGSSHIGSGDLEKYRRFLQDADLQESDNPMEVTALENGLVPEGSGFAGVDLEKSTTYCLYGV